MKMRKTAGMPTAAATTRLPARRLSVEQAAPILGVSVYMIRSLIRQRRLPYYRVGRRIVLDPGELEQFLQASRVETRTRPIGPPRGRALRGPTATRTTSSQPQGGGGSTLDDGADTR